MVKRPLLCLLSILSLLCGAGVHACSGSPDPPAAPPRRIVSTAPSVTEMLYALGLGDRVVGVTTFCHYPPEAAKKPKIGDYLHPSLETIVGLRPDLVVSETTGVRHAENLRSLKLNVLEIDDANLAGIYDSIRRIGQAAGVPARADALCARMRADLDAIRARVARLPRRRALFLVGRTPGRIEDLIAAGRASHLNELMEIAGGENVFRDSVAAYGRIPLEELLARNPEVIVDMGEMSETVGVTDAQKRAVVAALEPLPRAGRRPRASRLRRGVGYFRRARPARGRRRASPGPHVPPRGRPVSASPHALGLCGGAELRSCGRRGSGEPAHSGWLSGAGTPACRLDTRVEALSGPPILPEATP